MTNPLSAAHLDTIYSALYEWRQGLRERNTIYIVNDYEQAIDRIDAALAALDTAMPSTHLDTIRQALIDMHWSHRNGDTEPPTVVGWYWFTGRTYSNGGTSGVWFVTVTSRSFVVGEEGEIEDWKGQWWGPVAPPWDSAAPTPDWASAPAYRSGTGWRESLQRRPPSE